LDFRRFVLSPEYPKGDISPGSRTSCPYEAGEESLQRRSLMGDDDGLFISGPGIVEILNDNRPIDRCNYCSPKISGTMLPQPQWCWICYPLDSHLRYGYLPSLHGCGSFGY